MRNDMKLSNVDLINIGLITAICLTKLTRFSEFTSIVTDEIQYKEIILGLKEAHLFNPGYYSLFSIVKYAKEGWYLGVRIINIMFIYAAAEAIRRICILYGINGINRILVCISMICTGLTTYMLNVMPECMYIAVIYWTLYIVLRIDRISIRNTLIVNSLAGFLALVKPHGVIIYPIILLTYLAKEKNRKTHIAKNLILSVLVFIMIRWGVGYCTSGEIAFGIFGGTYESLGNKNIIETLNNTIYVVKRHALAWMLITPFLLSWMYIAIKGMIYGKIKGKEIAVQVLACGIIIISILAYSMFTSSVNTNENAQVLRIHLRYYSFITPLIVISAINMEKNIRNIANKWEMLMVNVVYMLLTIIIGFNLSFPLKGNWIDSPMLIIIENQETFMLLIAAGITIALFITTRKSLMQAIYYTLAFLIVSETKQWDMSYRAMKESMQSANTYNYINTKTNGQYIVLIKGETQEKTKTTKNEMIDCIKLVMLQTERSFREICKKNIDNTKEGYVVTYSHIDYGKLLDMYCPLTTLQNLGQHQKALHIKKDYEWDNLNKDETDPRQYMMNGFYDEEKWGRWGKSKKTTIITKQLINGNAEIKFKARSLKRSNIKIGNKVVQLNDQWRSVSHKLSNEDCVEKIDIEYDREPSMHEGRTLSYAMKDLEIINKNH